MNAKEAVVEFAKHAFRAEFMTPPGVVNVIGVFTTFVLALAAGLADLGQVIGRALDPGFESGLPSAFSFLLIHLVWLFVCMAVMVVLYDRGRDSS